MGDYWMEVQLLSTEIEDAITIHHTHEEINRCALEDQVILKMLNSNSLFWQTQMHCMQTCLFITLSRIFDNDANAITIHKLIAATLRNIDLFSAESLASRKTDAGITHPLLDAYISKAWVPTSANDLRHLKAALKPHAKRFSLVYRPIRHSIFAHRLMSNSEADARLFADTSRAEISVVLDFLHDLIDAISGLYLNGLKPELGHRSYKEYNQRIRDGARSVLKRFPVA